MQAHLLFTRSTVLLLVFVWILTLDLIYGMSE